MDFNTALKLLERPAREIFGANPDDTFRTLSSVLHPDLNGGCSEAVEAFKVLNQKYEELNKPVIAIKSKTREYKLLSLISSSDISDIYDAGDCIVKAVRNRSDNKFMDREVEVINLMRDNPNLGTFDHYLPNVLETFNLKGGRKATVFTKYEGVVDLLTIKKKYDEGIDPKHVGWLFKRILGGLGYAHSKGVVHGSILPQHLLVDTANHGVRIVGWGQSLFEGETPSIFSSAYKSWYPKRVFEKKPCSPSTDIAMAARCCIYSLGGDILSLEVPKSVPIKIKNFLSLCVKTEIDDAWGLHDDFNELLRRLFGSPKFHVLEI